MVKFPIKKLGGKSFLVLMAVCTALLPLVGFCEIVNQEYFKEKYDNDFLNAGYNIENIFYTVEGRKSVLALYRNNGTYEDVELTKNIDEITVNKRNNIGSSLHFITSPNYYQNVISKDDLMSYLKANPKIILSRYKTDLLNYNTSANTSCNAFYNFMNAYYNNNTENYVIPVQLKSSEQFNLYVNQDGNFVIKDFKYENFISYPSSGLKEINSDYSIDSSNFQKINEMLKSGQEQISFVIGAVIYGFVVFVLLWYSLKWIGTAISNRL